MIQFISDLGLGLYPIFKIYSGFNPALSHLVSEPNLENLIGQVAGVGETKAGGVISQ